MVIADRQFSFLYTARTGRDAFPFDPEEHWPLLRIWRVAYEVQPTEIVYGSQTKDCLWGDQNVLSIAGSKNLLCEVYLLGRRFVWHGDAGGRAGGVCVARPPISRIQEPEDVADVVLFRFSDACGDS